MISSKPRSLSLTLACASLLLAGAAQASNFSKAVYNGAKDDIKSTFRAEHDACKSLSGNARDICVKQAKGHEKVALARLEFDYSGQAADEVKWLKARHEARYDIATERCDDLAGDAKSLCVQEAKTARDKAKADVKLAKKVTQAVEEAESARIKADYKLARERCDTLGGDARDVCVASAKARFEG